MKQSENIGRADLLLSQQVIINEFIELGESLKDVAQGDQKGLTNYL